MWSIPAPRTKGNREHRVPLCRRALEILQAALAHKVRSQIEAAYRRPDLFERRRRLMDDWAGYLAGVGGASVETAADVRSSLASQV